MPLAASAFACAAAWAAGVDPALIATARRDGVADVLIVLADQSHRRSRRWPCTRPTSCAGAPWSMPCARAPAAADGSARLARGARHRPSRVLDRQPDPGARRRGRPCRARAAQRRQAHRRRIRGSPRSCRSRPPASALPQAPEAIAWGVAMIKAPAVWARGFTGQGVVIAGEDTGYQWDHPALQVALPRLERQHGRSRLQLARRDPRLARQFRAATIRPHPATTHGHGTHTAGTFAGDDGGQPPDRRRARREMDRLPQHGRGQRHAGALHRVHAMDARADRSQRRRTRDPDLAPDVVSNSWGCIAGAKAARSATRSKAAVDNSSPAGIFFAAGAANDGPACGTITDAAGDLRRELRGRRDRQHAIAWRGFPAAARSSASRR